MRERTGRGPAISIQRGDLTAQHVDAIVNAANTSMRPGSGVDGAITRVAGPEALRDRERVAAERGDPPLPTGTALATVAGDLPCRWIIHTAGPVYGGTDRDRQQLASCHVASLAAADALGAASVAFPAISCGVYGYPPAEAAPIALASVAGADTRVREVRFVLFDEEIARVFAQEAGRLGEGT